MMINITNPLSACPGFQPNSVAAHRSPGFNSLIAGLSLRPSFSGLMAGNSVRQMAETTIFQGYRLGEISLTMMAVQQPLDQMQQIGGFTDWNFLNKINKGKHYSRPDGLPLSPPPKYRRRYEKEGGVATS